MKKYLQLYVREMKNRNYSPNTIRIYSMHIQHFLEFAFGQKFDLYERISIFLEKEKTTAEQKRLAWSSIKLFYKLALKKECPYNLSKMRGQKRLPDVLTHLEVLEILNCISNTKHHLMISLGVMLSLA